MKLLSGRQRKPERQIKTKPCVMYATTTCPFCAKAKTALTSMAMGMGTMYTVVNFDHRRRQLPRNRNHKRARDALHGEAS